MMSIGVGSGKSNAGHVFYQGKHVLKNINNVLVERWVYTCRHLTSSFWVPVVHVN